MRAVLAAGSGQVVAQEEEDGADLPFPIRDGRDDGGE
jgi:hypothetical protein